MVDAMPVSDEERGVLESVNPLNRAPDDSPLQATMGIRPEQYDLPASPLRRQTSQSGPQTQDEWPVFEELIKKAALDPAFCRLLLSRPPKAVQEAGLRPSGAEVRFIVSISQPQLQALVDAMRTSEDRYRALLAQTKRTVPPPASLYATRGIRPDD
jgi:hypothetical protein